MRIKSHIFINYIRGFIIGASDIVPGVSGGTMALVLGIYEKILNEINKITKVTKQFFSDFNFIQLVKSFDFYFLIPLLFGLLSAVFFLSGPLTFALERKPILVWSFFFGLVAGSSYFVRKKINYKVKMTTTLTIFGFILGYLFSGLVPRETPATPIFFILSGAIAISATILPGISGSFVLLLLGKYEQILRAVYERDLFTIFVFLLGIVLGLLLFSRLVSWFLRHYHDLTLSLLLGIMCGSLRKIWPWKESDVNVFPVSMDMEFWLVIFLSIVGFSLVLFMDRLSDFNLNKSKNYEE